ncbi:MAG: hypothetical protein HQM10_23900 [Candidatus Riflebacteria bacterium]|nr:hypothetical protein [Candidatus Riflebacteria bacterium]
MARKGITLRKIKEILRLKLVNQLSFRQIARACQVSKTTAKDYVERAEKANLNLLSHRSKKFGNLNLTL